MKTKWLKKCQRLIVLWCLACVSVSIAQENASESVLQSEEALKKLIEQTVKKTADRVAQQTAKHIFEKINTKQPAKNSEVIAQEKQSQVDLRQTGKQVANMRLLGLGSGSLGGNYFVLGELVGGVISHPVGSLACGQGGSCGVTHLQSMNITSAGSIANLAALKNKDIATGFVQSDVAYWAYTGTGLFENKEKMSDLRAIASLYPEAVHIIVRKKANINSVADLKDKKVSIGARKSGTLLQARLVLGAYSLSEDDMQPEYLNNLQSIEKLKAGELDAMFFSVGVPAPALIQLFGENDEYALLSLADSARKSIFRQGSYFSPYTIEKNTYPNVDEVNTISVFALWLCSSKLDNDLVYQMTKSLWHEASRQLLNSSDIGRQVLFDNSLQGIGIPLHDGAKKYYNEVGKRF